MWEKVMGFINPFKILEWLIGYFNRPILEIYYDPNETYHKAKDLSFSGVLTNFVHVMVRNKGKHLAKNCIGQLISIKKLKDGEFYNIPEYRNIMNLKWAHEKDFSPKDIDRDYPKRLDVCYVHRVDYILHFFTEKYPSGNQTDFPSGLYKIKIRVRCDNANTTEKEFIVDYSVGDFDGLKIKNV